MSSAAVSAWSRGGGVKRPGVRSRAAWPHRASRATGGSSLAWPVASLPWRQGRSARPRTRPWRQPSWWSPPGRRGGGVLRRRCRSRRRDSADRNGGERRGETGRTVRRVLQAMGTGWRYRPGASVRRAGRSGVAGCRSRRRRRGRRRAGGPRPRCPTGRSTRRRRRTRWRPRRRADEAAVEERPSATNARCASGSAKV